MGSPRKPTDIFINCPFDHHYKPIFDALVFAVFDCGFRPRSALELADGGEVRLDKICRIISECRYAIHDISRTELDEANELPRFNMPFELGLFLGASRFGQGGQRLKRCLILDRTQHRFQKFISDIAGQDISAHQDKPALAIKCVREWLRAVAPDRPVAGANYITGRFQTFSDDLPQLANELKLQSDEITYRDLCVLIAGWLERFA